LTGCWRLSVLNLHCLRSNWLWLIGPVELRPDNASWRCSVINF